MIRYFITRYLLLQFSICLFFKLTIIFTLSSKNNFGNTRHSYINIMNKILKILIFPIQFKKYIFIIFRKMLILN